LKAWPLLGVLIVQTLLCLAHWFLYCTWIDFWWPMSPTATVALRVVLATLSVSFMVAALLGFRFTNWLVALVYQLAAAWLGLLNFLFVGACLAWLADLPLRLAPGNLHLRLRPYEAAILLAAAVLTALYGLLNARQIRLRKVTVRLKNLPAAWHGRRAVVMSDLHLGNINGVRFARRIADMVHSLQPDIIFLPGDLYDGTKADAEALAEPLFQLTPPLGVYFVSGNHEEFGGASHYSDALRRRGFHVLDNAQVEIDGVLVLGVPYRDTSYPVRLQHFLVNQGLENGKVSILLQHVPNRLPMVEQSGVSLQLSGHTHGGQVFPFSWITRRAFGKFTYGLHPFGDLQVYTSSGAGTWGPPMRVGTHPEIVLLTFE